MGFFINQFRKVIQWENVNSDEIVYKYPLEKKEEIMKKSTLVVREGQCAVFINQGKLADVFMPGTYSLKDVKNIPLLTAMYSWTYAFESPFTADIIFFQTKQFLDNKWGTSKPIMMRDKDFGMVRIRGFGKYSFAIKKPQDAIFEIAGSTDYLYVSDVDKYFRSIITSILSNSIAELGCPALDLAMNYDDITLIAKEKLEKEFSRLGIEIKGLYIENLSLPSDVEKMIDKRTGVGVMKGSIDDYAKIETVEAMRDAAKNPGNGNNEINNGLNTGLGLAFALKAGKEMMNQTNDQTSKPSSNSNNKVCPKCNFENKPSAKFCSNCGTPLGKRFCKECGTEVKENAKFCPNCGGKL